MKKTIIAAAALLVLAFMGYRVYLALVPEESWIRSAIRDMEASFNRAEAGGIVRHLAEDFTEEESGLGKNEIRLLLVQVFLAEKDKKGKPLHSVEAPPEDTEVRIREEPGKPLEAEIQVKARFFVLKPPGAEPSGTILFTGKLSKADGSWRIVRARHRVIEGRRPF